MSDLGSQILDMYEKMVEDEKQSWVLRHSPNEIEVLIHYNSSPVVHPRIDAPAVKEAMSRFIDNGIFRTISELPYCELTIKGRMWLEMICSTPYPETRLVDPDGRVVPRKVDDNWIVSQAVDNG